VLDARIIEIRWVPVDDGAFHDVVSIGVVTPTLLISLADEPFSALIR